MRLIDAEQIGLTDMDIIMCDGNYKKALEMLIDKIANAPSIDAVPIIRCRDCKWWDEKEDSPYGYCMAMKHGYFSANWEIGIYRTYKGDWYCADGERKEE